MKASEIREILKLTESPEMISFAGGLPDPDLFPVEEIARLSGGLTGASGKAALQYSTTEGYLPLREKIAARMRRIFGIAAEASDVLITTGSQQGLDLSGKIWLDPGDIVLCESPTYLGAINALRAYEPQFVELKTDGEGVDLAQLSSILESGRRIKLIYVNPDFQNPTGRTWSLERRRGFMEIANRYDVAVLEDNPYGELRYEGELLPALKSMDTRGNVVFMGSFSKIFCPGYRVGWLIAEAGLLEKYVLVKQAADLHTSSKAQREIDLYLENYDIERNISRIKSVYARRRDVMLESISRYFPASVKVSKPEGGLFVWAELSPHVDAVELLKISIARQVAFVPGGPFYPNGGRAHTMRLNFSVTDERRIEEGIRRLAEGISAI